MKSVAKWLVVSALVASALLSALVATMALYGCSGISATSESIEESTELEFRGDGIENISMRVVFVVLDDYGMGGAGVGVDLVANCAVEARVRSQNVWESVTSYVGSTGVHIFEPGYANGLARFTFVCVEESEPEPELDAGTDSSSDAGSNQPVVVLVR